MRWNINDVHKVCMWNELQLEKTYLLTYAHKEDFNQPMHPSSLISLCCPHEETVSLAIQNALSEDSDQTAGVCRWSVSCAAQMSNYVHEGSQADLYVEQYNKNNFYLVVAVILPDH